MSFFKDGNVLFTLTCFKYSESWKNISITKITTELQYKVKFDIQNFVFIQSGGVKCMQLFNRKRNKREVKKIIENENHTAIFMFYISYKPE